jgi:hypothetical protein
MNVVAEKRTLKMHPKLLLDVIGRQAGSLDKALLEGGMNGIEAINALKMNGGVCNDEAIYFTYKKDAKAIITIQDFGKGITSKKEVEEFFETFGTPHDESEHKIYAQFRMGRGQMFNFGKNIWRTGTFELVVDVLRNGLEWELKENLPFVEGCHITIELYDKYLNSWPAHSVDCLKESVKKQMEFVFAPVYFNGEQINTPPQDCKWDFEDKFAYYAFNIGDQLSIYNLGVYVRDKWETKGIVVSKQQLKLNFPRNDVMADCPIWYHISEVVRKNVVKKSQKTYIPMSSNERRSILKSVRDGMQKFEEVKGSRILQTAQDKYMSFLMLLKNKQPWTIAPVGNRQADRCIQQGTHVVFAKEMLNAMNYSGEPKHFFSWLLKTLAENNHRGSRNFDWYLDGAKEQIESFCNLYQPLEKAVEKSRSRCTIIATNQLTKVEKRVISTLESFNCWGNRQIRIGVSSGALAWTDGRCFINLDRKWLRNLSLDWDGDIAHMFHVMAHELAHDDDTSDTDIHGEDFYENYHELTSHRGHKNPFTHCLSFKEKMRSALLSEKRELEKQKEQEALAEKAKKLGISG